ncbi:MAG TPA: neutral/alkaline non-lysosomal ceramidase N-terminal domain-containing protein [Baekduia sp.]|nr:neutral/alkaline non-lysosomal ceramidase N-terminal domain-containing protein [Baekduia sp.]
MTRRAVAPLAAVVAVALAAPAAAAQNGTLRAGVGKADITPRLGYYLGGWTRADRTAQGQHTRLHARALVLQRGERKVALVSVDLFMVGGGLVKHVGDALADRGFSERNVLISASHTHSGPGGYGNFPSLNTASPSLETVTDPFSFARLLDPEPADRQLYAFLVRQIATAIRRADEDRGAAQLGWGRTQLTGLTRNRSLEAHLHNHGIVKARGAGRDSDDPLGAVHTIDPDVDVLRVDKLVARRDRRGRRRIVRVPVGGWSTFADHGTVTKSTFEFYNGDHHASAMRVFEAAVRRRGRVPAGQEVLNVYGNSNEGDMSAGLDRHGPAASDYVGRAEARAMLRAWQQAGGRMTRRPVLDLRWTRMCFCGQQTEGGPVADRSQVGLPFLTGSEEERGPLFEVTGQHYEDTRNPVGAGPHGAKIAIPAGNIPNVVPLLAVRVGDRLVVSLPAEGTKEVGARLRAAVGSAVAGAGIARVVVSGLANEFVLYLTTPEEYDRQHYEGGNTHFGRQSSVLVTSEIARLAGTLVRGEPAPDAVAFDPTNGVSPEGPPYEPGAATGQVLAQPAPRVARLQRAALRWQGGRLGLDRPLERAFVVAQRRTHGRWVAVDDDLGLAMRWRVDDAGVHDVLWEVPRDARAGTHRLVVQANRYTLVSDPFEVAPSRALELVPAPAPVGRVGLALAYPAAVRDVDLTHRPSRAPLGRVTLSVGGRRLVLDARGARSITVPAAGPIVVERGGLTDRYGNANADRAVLGAAR